MYVGHWRSADENSISIHNIKWNLTWSEKCMPLGTSSSRGSHWKVLRISCWWVHFNCMFPVVQNVGTPFLADGHVLPFRPMLWLRRKTLCINNNTPSLEILIIGFNFMRLERENRPRALADPSLFENFLERGYRKIRRHDAAPSEISGTD